MVLRADKIAELLNDEHSNDPLVVTPLCDVDELTSSGAGSIDLRLGTWFLTLRPARMSHLTDSNVAEAQVAQSRYVPFGETYFLHPRSFVLGVTLEWIRLPTNLAGSVVGKSSWGRRGLIIATATGVHPGFTGCLTLELANVGEMPIAMKPGVRICQLTLMTAAVGGQNLVDQSQFLGQRKPSIGQIDLDPVARKLGGSKANS